MKKISEKTLPAIKLVLMIILWLINYSVQSQKMSIYEIDSLTGEQYSIIVKKQFNAVINSSGKTTIGNYASADINDGRLSFNATRNFKNGDMLSFNANGGVTDGFFAMFNQSRINSNIGVEFKYNKMFKKMSSLSFYIDEIEKLNKRLEYLDIKYKLSGNMYIHDSVNLEKKLTMVNIEISSLTIQMGNSSLTELERANVEYQISLRYFQRDSIDLKLTQLKYTLNANEEYKKNMKKDKLAAIEEFDYTAVRLKWLSMGAGFQNNSFNRFQPLFKSLDSQISKQKNTIWNLVVEWNLYRWHHYSKYTYYLLIGGKFTVEDNFSDLTKMELTDSRQYGDSTIKRTSDRKTTAYQGDYQTKLVGGKFYIDFYKFFLGNAAAIHIYPEANFRQSKSPLYNGGIGFLYSFKDSKDKENKGKLNVELYLKLTDLSNTAKSELTLWQRNELGLRLSFPISFFNL